MSRMLSRAIGVACLAGLVSSMAVTTAAAGDRARTQHVLLLSVDGLHQSDLAWYIRTRPSSALAKLVRDGVEFTNAKTPVPSDSFPGMVGQITGGNPSSTGIYYDDSWNRVLLPAGTTSCAGVAPGVEVTYFEQRDKNPLALDAGQGLSGLPGSILQLTGNAKSLIDPAQLPVDPVFVQAGLSRDVPAGEHDFRGGPRRRLAHRLVRQAPGVRDPQRSLRDRGTGPLHAPRSTATHRSPVPQGTGPATTR